jgi:(S)-ureidoglycine-glyoxylate aminotransferase
MDYWGESRLNHHTEATSMLYAAREAVRLVLAEGLDKCFARHRLASEAITSGLKAMGLQLFGDQTNKMANVTGVVIPDKVDGDAVRGMMLNDFGIEIGTSFGPLRGKIWRIGTMGYVCRKENVLICLSALETCLRQCGFSTRAGAGPDAALTVYRAAEIPARNAAVT